MSVSFICENFALQAKNERWKDTAALEDGFKYQISSPTNPTPLSSPPSSLSKKPRDDKGNSVNRNKRETGEKSRQTDDEYWYYDSTSSQDDEPMPHYDFPTFNSGDNFTLYKAPRLEKLKLARNPTTRELKEMGHKVEDFIVQCKFNNRICDYSDFTTVQNKHYGNCFTFNHGGENDSAFGRVTKAGSSYGNLMILEGEDTKPQGFWYLGGWVRFHSGTQIGLHLTLFIELHEYVGLLTEESGVRLIAHPRNIYPHPEDVGLSVSPGFSTSIGIRKIEIKRLPAPYGNCIKIGGRHNYLHNGTHAYSILSCQKKCMLDEMAKRCSCVTNIYDDYQNISQCGVNEKRCRQSVEKEFYSNEMNCFCPAPCHEYVYSTRVTSSLWPSKKYHRHLAEKLRKRWNLLSALENVSTARENFVRLEIYFEELNYELVEQIPAHTIESVSGTIGGLLGLYVGFSVITVCEFTVLLYDIIAVALKKS